MQKVTKIDFSITEQCIFGKYYYKRQLSAESKKIINKLKKNDLIVIRINNDLFF